MAFVPRIIVGDETRHHSVLEEMANSILGEIEFRDIEPRVPYLVHRPEDEARLLEQTQRFLDFEREDLGSLRSLRKELRLVRHTSLLSLLVELMELDTRKHIAILEFIRKQARCPW